jgi:uncharacterized protein
VENIVLLGIGLGVGLVSGALGIGGGVLMLPALVWLCRMPPIRAAGTTLAVLVVPVVLPAAWEYYRRDYVDIRAALWVAAAFAVGGYGGAWLRSSEVVPEHAFRVLFGLVMMYVSWQVLISSDSEAIKAAAGMIGALGAWLCFLRLRAIGRRALAQPTLQSQIKRMEQEGHGDPDYYI